MDYPTFYYISHRKFLKLPELIDEYYKIIRGWILENDDFRNVIPRYDGNDTIFYLDPPYLGWSWYNHNFTESDMRDLKELLDNILGRACQYIRRATA
jgi:DNA adenine methylase